MGNSITEPIISVIMTVYNSEKYISEAVNSVLNQTFKDFEFIIVNDASTDTTLDILKQFDDERIILLENNENKGTVFSANRAIRIAKGKYIARVDSDDVFLPEKLEKQFNYLEQNNNVSIVGCQAIIIDETGNEIKQNKWPVGFNNVLFEAFTNVSPVGNPMVLIRKSDLLEVGKYRDFFPAEDLDLWLRFILKGKVIDNLPDTLFLYRRHGSQGTKEKKDRMLKSREVIFNEFYKNAIVKKHNIAIDDELLNRYANFRRLVKDVNPSEIIGFSNIYLNLIAGIDGLNNINKPYLKKKFAEWTFRHVGNKYFLSFLNTFKMASAIKINIIVYIVFMLRFYFRNNKHE